MTLNIKTMLSEKGKRRPKVCFACSGGGHLRQLLQLTPLVEYLDFYFLTEKSPLGMSVKDQHPACFVHHCALGQRKQFGCLKFWWSASTNFVLSTYHFFRHQPDIVISTGAGAAYFTLVLAKVFKKKSIYIESIARVSSVSKFGKKSEGLVDLYLVQWPTLDDVSPNAVYCNPLKEVQFSEKKKKDKICVTVGTVLPFDRMVKYVDRLKSDNVITEEVFAQVGDSDVSCVDIETQKSVPYDELVSQLEEAKIAIVHGGSGSILGALQAGCIVIAMPREEARSEHYDDHQFELVSEFRDRGLLLEARNIDELAEAIKVARTLQPQCLEIDPDSFAVHINKFLRNEGAVSDAELQSKSQLIEQ